MGNGLSFGMQQLFSVKRHHLVFGEFRQFATASKGSATYRRAVVAEDLERDLDEESDAVVLLPITKPQLAYHGSPKAI